MEIDVRSLETYNELARTGAEAAATALSELTGIETRVEVTGVSLCSRSDLRYEFGDRELAGVSVSLGHPLTGEIVLAFDERGRGAIADELVDEADPGRVESAIVEVGNIVANGFVGGWADHLGTKVETSPPVSVSGTGVDVLSDVTDGDRAFVFRSRIAAVTRGVDFRIHLVPDADALERLIGREADGGIPLETLEVFAEMTERGAARAAHNVETVTGLDATVEVNRLHFTPVVHVQDQVGDDRSVGAIVAYRGPPGGYFALLFDPDTARTVVDASYATAHERTHSERERANGETHSERERANGEMHSERERANGETHSERNHRSEEEAWSEETRSERHGEEAWSERHGEETRSERHGEETWSERERGVVEELCNLVASGFLDGWANVLETSIEHPPPIFVADMSASIVSPLVADVARTKPCAFVLDSTIETGDADGARCELLAIPHPDELEAALDELLVERAGEMRADPGDLF